MIASSDGRWVVDGGVNTDQKSIWSLDVANAVVRIHGYADGWAVRVFSGQNGHFAVARYGHDFIELVALAFGANPSEPLALIRAEGERSVSRGDVSVWRDLPPAFAGFRPTRSPTTTHRSAMLVVDREYGTLDIDDMEWFELGNYDRDYQSPLDPVELPGSNLLLIPVSRSSRPVLYDRTLQRVAGEIALPDFGSISNIQIGPQPGLIWAWGDGLLRIRALDGAPPNETNLTSSDRLETTLVTPGPVADLAFDDAGAQGAIGMRHSGEVWRLDPQSLALSLHRRTGFVWPQVAIVPSGRIIVRDSMTGETDGIA